MRAHRFFKGSLLAVAVLTTVAPTPSVPAETECANSSHGSHTDNTDRPGLPVTLVSAIQGDGVSIYHWRISRDSVCQLAFGWFSGSHKKVRDYSIDATPKPDTIPIDLKLIVREEEGFFRLTQELSEGKGEQPARREHRMELPEQCKIRESYVAEPLIVTNARNQPLWTGTVIHVQGEATKKRYKVWFIARALKPDESLDTLRPPFDPLRVPPDSGFTATGKVMDHDGRPMYGVTVLAATGAGTLLGGGDTVTGPDGRYVLHFGPGVLIWDERTGKGGIGTQAAVFFAMKPGYFEQNLCRHGDCVMTETLEGVPETHRKSGRYVLKDVPHEINFVLLPAAVVEGRLIDGEVEPVAGQRLSVDARELPPASSVLTSFETDTQGRFSLDSLPVSKPMWFALSHYHGVDREKHRHGIDLQSAQFSFDRAGVYELTVLYDREAPKLQVTRVGVSTEQEDGH